jgi:hypothetical protein
MPAVKGFLAVSASFFCSVSCCEVLQTSSKEINELPRTAIHSTQHGRNMAVRFPFTPPQRKPAGGNRARPSPFPLRMRPNFAPNQNGHAELS